MANIRPLTPELQQVAEKELFEDPNRIEKDLEAFREWIGKSKHIKGCTDDQFLIAFLRRSKYSLEIAKQRYDLFYTLKTHAPELCRNRDPKSEKMLDLIRQGGRLVLPNTETPGGPRYILVRQGVYNPAKHSITDIMKLVVMSVEAYMQEDDNFNVAGVVSIMDFSNVSLQHFMQFNPTIIKQVSMMQQDALPLKLQATHYVKMPQIGLAVFNLFQSFTSEEARKKVKMHGDNMEELFKDIPKRLLPEEYGGDAGPLQAIIDENERVLMKYRDYFLKDEQFGVDEKKRIGKAQNPDSLFGIAGSFRKLDID